MYNKVILIGNLGKDAEVTATDSIRIIKFPLATSESFKSDGEWVNRATWHDIVLFSNYDDNVAESFKKGDKVFIEGKISKSSYEDKDGVKRYSVDIIAAKARRLSNEQESSASASVTNEAADFPF